MDRSNDQLNFHVALFNPEIPSNTGNIGRICVGCNAKLHLIKPIKFFLTDKYLKRAGLDYWDKLNLEFHENIELFFEKYKSQNIYLCTTKGKYIHTDIEYERGDVFMFGPETKGLPSELIHKYPEQTIRIPMTEDIRSLNLANSVAVILYEAWRQLSFQ
ncbi:MAG: tRNA (uridine(34)/cytosine(34)/5-carboxymethylaminomethyluridine(34)-2'-O)-methyltransferase TrmL [Candidatus Cloacimonetes bacterium]|nr:tRNA (uridine(34)/cytosine(34)/5-carboxymethylaminomethyluridine(34)-2'-O)-methyltransferase TrmL [Candidatus Cloacimonadota bacterium]